MEWRRCDVLWKKTPPCLLYRVPQKFGEVGQPFQKIFKNVPRLKKGVFFPCGPSPEPNHPLLILVTWRGKENLLLSRGRGETPGKWGGFQERAAQKGFFTPFPRKILSGVKNLLGMSALGSRLAKFGKFGGRANVLGLISVIFWVEGDGSKGI